MILRHLKKFYILYTKGTVKYGRKIGVQIGEGCRIYTTQFGSEPFLIKIGNKVTITSGVKFITHDGSTWLMRDEKGRRYLFQRIDIGNNVFIGVNSIIMPGVKIEDNVIVAAGSIITKSIPSGVIVAGVPAKIIGSYSEIEKRMLDLYFSDKDLNKKLNYEERINSVLTTEFKPFLK
jgi:acetyltransferase-like isoleucine patch superfamily enzyme